MKFAKYVFGTFLNGWGIAKYTDIEKVKIVAEHSDHPDGGEKTFLTNDDYEKWVDSLVDENTQTYNKANAVNILLDVLN